MIPGRAADETLPSTFWSRIAACVVGLVLLGNLTLGPLYALAVRKPATLPPRIRAIEGNVLIDADWQGGDGAYLLQTSHGKSLALYCGPWPYDFPCLHRRGLELGGVYRLTIAYGAEIFPDGETRNIITHAMYGDLDLVTPRQQLQAWNNTVTVYDARRGEWRRTRVDGLFWAFQALTGGIYAMLIFALIKNSLMLTKLYAGKRRV